VWNDKKPIYFLATKIISDADTTKGTQAHACNMSSYSKGLQHVHGRYGQE